VPIVYPDRITTEMQAWAHETVAEERGQLDKLRALLFGLLGPTGLKIQYEAEYTGTAVEVFESRQANCLSFTHLFVALAREVGVPTYYVTIDEIESFAKKGDLVVVSNHITAGYGPPHERTILDFTVRPDVDYQSAERISDTRAHALYYSNRGAEKMQTGDFDGAIDAFYIATDLDDDLPEAWSNLGVVRRRQGDHAAAAAAYRRAIETDPQYFPVYQNLLALYQIEGRQDAAQELVRLLDKRRNRNPYSYLVLGDVSLQSDRKEEARVFYRRARRLDRKNSEAMAALGQLALAEGDRSGAERWLEKARAIDPENSRAGDLEAALSPILNPVQSPDASQPEEEAPTDAAIAPPP